jgi:hypothetical protein
MQAHFFNHALAQRAVVCPPFPDDIVVDAQHAAEKGEPPCACPYPESSEATRRWRLFYHAKAIEICGDSTT